MLVLGGLKRVDVHITLNKQSSAEIELETKQTPDLLSLAPASPSALVSEAYSPI